MQCITVDTNEKLLCARDACGWAFSDHSEGVKIDSSSTRNHLKMVRCAVWNRNASQPSSPHSRGVANIEGETSHTKLFFTSANKPCMQHENANFRSKFVTAHMHDAHAPVEYAKLFRFVISHFIFDACCCCLVSLALCASAHCAGEQRNESNEINGQNALKTNIYPRNAKCPYFERVDTKSVVHCVAWKKQWEANAARTKGQRTTSYIVRVSHSLVRFSLALHRHSVQLISRRNVLSMHTARSSCA